MGELAPPEIDDRSDFVATDVADTVEAMLPQLMRPFVSSDDAVEFEARSPDGEKWARDATTYINYQFYTRNDGVGVMYDWFKDALLQKVGFVKVWAEEEAEDAEQTYEGQAPEQLVMLQQEGWQLTDEPKVDDFGGLTFTVKKEDRHIAFKVAACAPYEIRVDANARWGDEPAMIAHVYRKRKFELEEEGYDLTDIGAGGEAITGDPEALEMLGETQDQALAEPHASHALYQCSEVYIKLDADGDGIAEWLCCHLIENTLVDYEKTDGHPFVWICPVPRPHAFFGDCPADFAIQPQKLRTNLVRAIQDNLYLSVNQRTYINTTANVNISDWLENRPGGVVRGEGPAQQAIQPIVQPSLAAPAYEFNEWLTDWAQNRTGFTKYSQGTDANSLNKTATGVSIITQKADMRMELISRMFAVGMKQLFSKLLKLVTQHQRKAEWIKLNGQWQAIDPSEWHDQFHVKIKVGLGTGSKEQQAARVMGLMQAQQLGIPLGVVTPAQFAESIKLYVEANEFKNPERFVSPEPQGMPPNPQAYQAEKQRAMEQMQQLQKQLQQVADENGKLKQQSAQQQQDAALKQIELEQKAQQASDKHAETVANIQLKAADQDRKGREAHIKGVQTAHDMAAKDIDIQQNQQIAELQQELAELQRRMGMQDETGSESAEQGE